VQELVDFFVSVIAITAESSDAENLAQDEPCEHSFWMGRMRGKIEVEVEVLLVDCSVEPVVGDADCKIHKVDLLCTFRKDPLETVVRLPRCLKVIPILNIHRGVRVMQPDSNEVVDEALV
jgi:hypothetical protein